MMTDKDYAGVTLELVKMSLENIRKVDLGDVYLDPDDITNDSNMIDISSLYNYYYERITENNKQKVDQASIVKNTEKTSNNSEFLQRLREKVVENAGDMEPRVNTLLLNMIDTELKK